MHNPGHKLPDKLQKVRIIYVRDCANVKNVKFSFFQTLSGFITQNQLNNSYWGYLLDLDQYILPTKSFRLHFGQSLGRRVASVREVAKLLRRTALTNCL